MIGMNQLDTEDTVLNLTLKLCVDNVKDYMIVIPSWIGRYFGDAFKSNEGDNRFCNTFRDLRDVISDSTCLAIT